MFRVAIVTGGRGGLGKLITEQLEQVGYKVIVWDMQEDDIDLTDYGIIVKQVRKLYEYGKIDLLVNCAGCNRLGYIHNLDPYVWDWHMAVNARSIFYCVQALLPMLNEGTVCNVISNASHMPMTASLAYNASKAAAAMMTRQMARELWPTHKITVFGVSPNRLKGTPMSKSVDDQVSKVRGWSSEEVATKQQSAMAIGEETDPHAVAEFMAFLLSTKDRHKFLHGCIMEYGQ